MLTHVIRWAVCGIAAGLVARWSRPVGGRTCTVTTCVLGLLGATLGGGVAFLFRLGAGPTGLAFAALGAAGMIWLGVLGARHHATL